MPHSFKTWIFKSGVFDRIMKKIEDYEVVRFFALQILYFQCFPFFHDLCKSYKGLFLIDQNFQPLNLNFEQSFVITRLKQNKTRNVNLEKSQENILIM